MIYTRRRLVSHHPAICGGNRVRREFKVPLRVFVCDDNREGWQNVVIVSDHHGEEAIAST